MTPDPPGTVARFGIYALALPAVALLWFIHRYAVNMIFADQWHDIHIIALSHSGTLTLGDLWAQHGENRVFVPDLLVLALAHTTHFNVVYEDYGSGILLIATAALLILAHRRRSPSTPWIYYFPVVIVLLSLNQGTMTLWGFAVSWYLEIFALAAALFLLDRVALGWLGLAGAIAVTIAGAFSSLEGLLIWPVGLLLLYHRRRGRAMILAWITAAVVTTGLYMFHFDFTTAGTGTKSFVLTHPVLAASGSSSSPSAMSSACRCPTHLAPATTSSVCSESSSLSLPPGCSSSGCRDAIDRPRARSVWRRSSSVCSTPWHLPKGVGLWGSPSSPGMQSSSS